MLRVFSPFIYVRNLSKRNLLHLNRSQLKTKINQINSKTYESNLSNKSKYFFTNNNNLNRNEFQRGQTMPIQGYLSIRNSEKLQISYVTFNKLNNNILIDKNSTIKQLKHKLSEHFQSNDIRILCDQTIIISDLTPVEAFLNRFFFVIIDDKYSFKIDGQLLYVPEENKISQNLRNLELPLVIRREVQHYCERINTWIQVKYGVGLDNTTIKIPKNQAKKIIINAAVDPLQSNRRISLAQYEFQNIYWQVQQLLDKKSEAVTLCSKMVRNRMSLGLFFILSNIVFIWSGTYIFYSWDIIQPIAYFISSLAGIILFSRFFKIGKNFSLINYKNYMINKYMPIASKRIGFNLQELQVKQRKLIQLEANIKDHFLKKL